MPEALRARIGSRRWALWSRAARDALIAGALVLIGWTLLNAVLHPDGFMDAHAYWAVSSTAPYAVSAVGAPDAFLYSPAFLQVIAPLRMLPLPAFTAIWVAAGAAAFCALTGPFMGVVMFVFPPVFYELSYGNINLLLALAIVAGFRWPALWSAVLLTKVTPGIGLVWFAVRREWRSLALALGTTVAIAAASFLLVQDQWGQWLAVLARDAAHPTGEARFALPLIVRLPLAALLVGWGAVTDRRWTVVAAATLATPSLTLVSASLLVGVVPLLRHSASPWPWGTGRRPRSLLQAWLSGRRALEGGGS